MSSKYLNQDGTLNRQLVINDVWAGVKSQGFQLSVMMDSNGNYSDVCAYNGLNGTHCAIGWLMTDIPDDEVQVVEGTGIITYSNDTNYVLGMLGLKGISEDDLQFLAGLQNSHDEAWDSVIDQGPNFKLGAKLFENNLRDYITDNLLEVPNV